MLVYIYGAVENIYEERINWNIHQDEINTFDCATGSGPMSLLSTSQQHEEKSVHFQKRLKWTPVSTPHDGFYGRPAHFALINVLSVDTAFKMIS